MLWLFEERFDKDQWRQNPSQRYKMIDDLIESQLLIGKTKDEVVLVLGQPNLKTSERNNAFAYSIGDQPSFFDSQPEHLLVIFINNKVDEVTLAVE